jgi:hypothetical protein
LSVLSVICVNLGVQGPPVSDQHWIYAPEPGLPFHRIGVYSNFQPMPAGRSSLYLEITAPGPLAATAAGAAEDAAREFLASSFFRPAEHKVEVRETMVIPHAYVVYDHHRAEAAGRIVGYLKERAIESTGRYGRWEYSTMEDAILEGREAAQL